MNGEELTIQERALELLKNKQFVMLKELNAAVISHLKRRLSKFSEPQIPRTVIICIILSQ